MAYQAKRTSIYTEDFELVDESGRVAHSMKVSLDPGSVVEKLSKQYIELLRAKERVVKIQMDSAQQSQLLNAYSDLGNAVIAMIKSVFGEEDAAIILEFYRDNYNDIVVEVMPFITNIVLPEVRRIAQQKKKDNLKKYTRKQRRLIGRAEKKIWGI